MNQPKPFKDLNLHQVREYALTYETQHPGAHPTFYPSEEVPERFNDLIGAYSRQIQDLKTQVEGLQQELSRCHTSMESRDRLIIEQRQQLDTLEKARRQVPHYKIWRMPPTAEFSKKDGSRKAKPICVAIVAREVDADILVDLYNKNYADVFYYTPEEMNGTT